jgi:ABC-2 type transport system ATP-binding protein
LLHPRGSATLERREHRSAARSTGDSGSVNWGATRNAAATARIKVSDGAGGSHRSTIIDREAREPVDSPWIPALELAEPTLAMGNAWDYFGAPPRSGHPPRHGGRLSPECREAWSASWTREQETAVIELRELTKHYGDVIAVDQVSLRIQPGEIYALLGLNGAGKTTTIRMLLGMVRPTSGTVSVLGSEVRAGEQAVWSRVGYLVETPAAYPELTVSENLRVAGRLRGLTDRRQVDDVIGLLGLERYADRRARALSLGNAQRLGLAKALLHRPELLILDEPANGLDPAGVAEIRDLLHNLSREHGVTILLSSHILTEVARLATRIGIIHNGHLVRELDTGDVAGQTRPRLRVATRDSHATATVLREAGFSPESNGDAGFSLSDDRAVRRPELIATLLVEAGCPPTHLVVEQDDLETFFLNLVGAR